MGKWVFLVSIYNMKYTSDIIHIFPLLVILIFPGDSEKIIKLENKQMLVCLSACTCPKKKSPAWMASVLWSECVLLDLFFSVLVLHIPFTEIGGQATVAGGVVHSWGWRQGGVALGLSGGRHQARRRGGFITRAGCWWWVWCWWGGFVDLHVFS